MAVWQISIEFIPLEWAEANNYSTNSLYGEDGYDTSAAWKCYQPEKDLDKIFIKYYPKVNLGLKTYLFGVMKKATI